MVLRCGFVGLLFVPQTSSFLQTVTITVMNYSYNLRQKNIFSKNWYTFPISKIPYLIVEKCVSKYRVRTRVVSSHTCSIGLRRELIVLDVARALIAGFGVWAALRALMRAFGTLVHIYKCKGALFERPEWWWCSVYRSELAIFCVWEITRCGLLLALTYTSPRFVVDPIAVYALTNTACLVTTAYRLLWKWWYIREKKFFMPRWARIKNASYRLIHVCLRQLRKTRRLSGLLQNLISCQFFSQVAIDM